jgi:hypothetical protein
MYGRVQYVWMCVGVCGGEGAAVRLLELPLVVRAVLRAVLRVCVRACLLVAVAHVCGFDDSARTLVVVVSRHCSRRHSVSSCTVEQLEGTRAVALRTFRPPPAPPLLQPKPGNGNEIQKQHKMTP